MWLYAILSVSAVSLISLVGLAALSLDERRLRQIIFISVSLAVGAMFGDALIHLIPESFENSRNKLGVSLYVLVGIFAFFSLEKFIRWRHAHTLHSHGAIQPVGYLNLFADGTHNLIDGILIGASYTASLPLGLTTTIAVILHEIPQELGDFCLLLNSGFSKRGALVFNLLSASLAILGAVIALVANDIAQDFSTAMLPLTAGGFIYIAGSDLLPELHKELNPLKSIAQLLAIVTGAVVMLLLTALE